MIGIQIAQQIASDLRTTRSIYPMGPNGLKQYTPTEAGAPLYPNWAGIGAGALVTGYVQARDDGRITVVCYLYDMKQRREMARAGFAVASGALTVELLMPSNGTRSLSDMLRRRTGTKKGSKTCSVPSAAVPRGTIVTFNNG